MFLSAGGRQLAYWEGREARSLFRRRLPWPGERMAVAGVGLLAGLRVSDHTAGSIDLPGLQADGISPEGLQDNLLSP